MIEFPPGLLLILAALPVTVLRGPLRAIWMLALPVVAFAIIYTLPDGSHYALTAFGQQLELLRVDSLSKVFGYVFVIALFLGVIYSLHVGPSTEHVAGMVYAGAAIGAVFAGDLISLFVYWELTAIASVFLILARGTEAALGAAMRYLIIQVGSGVLLLAGLIVRWHETGSIEFGLIGLDGAGGVLILLAFGIKAAFPLLHNWLQDAYPNATPTGTVMLSAFTTKLAIYALARGYAGTEELIWIGAVMTAFPIFFAVVENDLRRVLAYSLNNQLGFMVVGVGIGTELALNGAAAHAFTHIIYKALLLMSAGSVLYMTGKRKCTDLGGLFRTMPVTALAGIVGALAISSFPFTSGFISKSMINQAAADDHITLAWFVLTAASAGVFLHAGIKFPWFVFFQKDSGLRPSDPPAFMRWPMWLFAFFCIGLGVFPGPLYSILPYPVDYVPYTASHLVSQFQLLLFAGLAFFVMLPLMKRTLTISLDFDWFYRRFGTALGGEFALRTGQARKELTSVITQGASNLISGLARHHGTEGILARSWPTGSMVLWVAILLVAYLIFYL